MKATFPLSHFFALLTTILLASSSSPAFGRVYKTLAGVPLEATFQELKTSASKQIVVLKMDGTGRLYETPLEGLSLPDQQYVKFADIEKRSQANSAAGEGTVAAASPNMAAGGPSLPPPSGRSIFGNLKANLVAVDGNRVKRHETTEEPDFYAFYFAASWCHVCHQFTPELARYYNYNISYANPKIEFIYVSRDQSQGKMEHYMLESKMPWPAIRYTDTNREKLIEQYAPVGTPSLVLVDRAGKIISESFIDGFPRGAFAVKQDIACWFTDGERTPAGDRIQSVLTDDKRVSSRR